MGIEIFKEILNFPLRDNPFFAKVISLGDSFNGDGIEDGDEDSSGYICQTLGNLDCDANHKPQCSGLGVIDCTPDCAGSEEEFKLFMKVMEDPEFATKYPQLAKAKMGGGKKKGKEMESGEAVDVGIEDEEENNEEPKLGAREKFFAGINKCSNFSEATLALVSLAGGTGGGFGGDTSDPNSLTYVDPNAISDIANIEYDYSDDYYYDDEEADVKDIGKERRNAEKDDDDHHDHKKMKEHKHEDQIETDNKLAEDIESSKSQNEIVEAVTKSQIKGKMDEKKMFEKTKHTNSKEEYYKSLNKLDGIDSKDITNEEEIRLNIIRSVDEDLELKDTNLLGQINDETKVNDVTNGTNTGVKIEKNNDNKTSLTNEDTSNNTDLMTTTSFNVDDKTTEGNNEYSDDDDLLFHEETTREETSTESILEKIVDIEVANDNSKKIGIDWDKLDTTKGKDQEKQEAQNNRKSTVERAKELLEEDSGDIHELFTKSVAIAKDGNELTSRVRRFARSFNNDDLAYRIAEKMRILMRKKRELETVETADNMTVVPEMPCKVKNMTCIKFPSKHHCKGIAVGRCGSRTDLLAKLFTPHVVMVTVVSVLVIVVVTVGLSYYCYKLKAENRVEPAEGEEEEPKNGDIKTVEPASPGDQPPA